MGGVVSCWHHACLAEIAVKNPGQCFTLPRLDRFSELTSDGQVSLENAFTVSATNWTLVATARVYIAIR
ncbi:hypothetical protein T10_394 [Trichinella papuae]|uniref:Uncharacterized protein n=1 Tax=Trichinella papuae TaxID=268474 RepID=A0A0V1MYB5_9BILA|nr:hypothetical protein T10_394 [Trichinella papuae]